MARDYALEGKQFADALEKDGFAAEAAQVREVIDFASTGGELLMGLRFRLSELQTLTSLAPGMKARALELQLAIQTALAG